MDFHFIILIDFVRIYKLYIYILRIQSSFLSHFYNIDYVYNLVCHTVYTNIYINGSIKEYNTNMSAMFPLLNDDSNCKELFVYLWST